MFISIDIYVIINICVSMYLCIFVYLYLCMFVNQVMEFAHQAFRMNGMLNMVVMAKSTIPASIYYPIPVVSKYIHAYIHAVHCVT